jgi:hypothetical protein
MSTGRNVYEYLANIPDIKILEFMAFLKTVISEGRGTRVERPSELRNDNYELLVKMILTISVKRTNLDDGQTSEMKVLDMMRELWEVNYAKQQNMTILDAYRENVFAALLVVYVMYPYDARKNAKENLQEFVTIFSDAIKTLMDGKVANKDELLAREKRRIRLRSQLLSKLVAAVQETSIFNPPVILKDFYVIWRTPEKVLTPEELKLLDKPFWRHTTNELGAFLTFLILGVINKGLAVKEPYNEADKKAIFIRTASIRVGAKGVTRSVQLIDLAKELLAGEKNTAAENSFAALFEIYITQYGNDVTTAMLTDEYVKFTQVYEGVYEGNPKKPMNILELTARYETRLLVMEAREKLNKALGISDDGNTAEGRSEGGSKRAEARSGENASAGGKSGIGASVGDSKSGASGAEKEINKFVFRFQQGQEYQGRDKSFKAALEALTLNISPEFPPFTFFELLTQSKAIPYTSLTVKESAKEVYASKTTITIDQFKEHLGRVHSQVSQMLPQYISEFNLRFNEEDKLSLKQLEAVAVEAKKSEEKAKRYYFIALEDLKKNNTETTRGEAEGARLELLEYKNAAKRLELSVSERIGSLNYTTKYISKENDEEERAQLEERARIDSERALEAVQRARSLIIEAKSKAAIAQAVKNLTSTTTNLWGGSTFYALG